MVVGGADIRDIKILETNTDDIVREIYRSGSASASAAATLLEADSPKQETEVEAEEPEKETSLR
ncbi:hypothetical protein D3C84_1213180 [compost metagenome]